MDNFNFNLLKYFYYIVLYNGFTKASRNLSVAQPSLSLNVKKLEDELGYKLIERNTKMFALTDEGKTLYDNIRPFFENIEQNIKVKNNSKKHLELNIAIRYSYSFLLSPLVMKKIMELFSNIKINVILYSKLDFTKIKNKEYDIVIDDIDYISLVDGIKISSVCSLKNQFVCNLDVYETYKNVKSILELDQVKIVSYNPNLKTGKFNKMCYENNVSFIDYLSVNESNLFLEYIRNFDVIGFTNELFLSRYNDLTTIDIEEEIFKDELAIAYLNENEMVNSIKEIIKDSIKESIK